NSISSQSINQEFHFNEFNIKLPEIKLIPGKAFNTGWSDEDGVVYELLFCRFCTKPVCLGVKILAVNIHNQELLNNIWIFEKRVKRETEKKQMSLLEPGCSQDTAIDLDEEEESPKTPVKRENTGFVSAKSLLSRYLKSVKDNKF